VLEIGAGTGYNAAIMSRLTGAPVVSIDVQPEVVDEARKALRHAGISGVLVEHSDGYAGFPARGPFDRIIVTCGIRGVPPGWLDQLRAGGFALVPLAHAGLHPIVRVERDGTATVYSGRAGFMHAAGPLYPSLPDDFPPPIDECPQATLTVPEPRLRRDFWFAAGALDRRVTRVNVADGWAPALVTGPGLAWWTDDEIRTAGTGPEAARRLVDRWVGLGRPSARAWTAPLTPALDAAAPLLVATRWRLASSAASSAAHSAARSSTGRR
jgi:protein-L-isoaspartate(D-aspartate) O-methyltransferase